MQFATRTISDQLQALRTLENLIVRGGEHPRVVAAARKIVLDCPSRDDECELQAIYDAVKSGTPLVRALARGFPYRADPKTLDFFASADRLLAMCDAGACGGDCDEHTVLCGALAHALGFTVGARAFGRTHDEYVHVYAVALLPKKAESARQRDIHIVGMDTTVPRAFLGWQPPRGAYRTAWPKEVL